MTRENRVIVTVDEKFNKDTGQANLCIRSASSEKLFAKPDGDIMSVRDATPEQIKNFYLAEALLWEDELSGDPSSTELMDKVAYYRKCARNVPGLKRH
jgi:hypothetical protein